MEHPTDNFIKYAEHAEHYASTGDYEQAALWLAKAEEAAQSGAARVYCASHVVRAWLKIFDSRGVDEAFAVLKRCEDRALTAPGNLCVSELWDCASFYGVHFGIEAMPDIRRCLLAAEARVSTDSYALSLTARYWLESYAFNPNSAVEAHRLHGLAAAAASDPYDNEFNKETADMITAVLKGQLL